MSDENTQGFLMSDAIHAKFVGGPDDGLHRFLPSETNEVTIQEFYQEIDEHGKVKIVNHKYARRSVNGIFVRLPNGFYPFDWKGIA